MFYKTEILTGNPDRELSSVDPENVICKLSTSIESLDICEWSCRVLATLTLVAANSKDLDLQCRLLDLGICEILISVISLHGANSQIVSAFGLCTFR